MRRLFPLVSAAGALAVMAAAACTTATQRSPSGSGRPLPAAHAGADSGHVAYTAADVHFMSGMIYHHAQAVLIAGWAPTHDASQSVRALCERIVVGQRDEIALMQRWLGDRHEEVPEPDAAHAGMPGMAHSMSVPGMLTAEQLAQWGQTRSLRWRATR